MIRLKKVNSEYGVYKDIPKTARSSYSLWINHFPESGHTTSWELFYIFVNNLLTYSRKERGRVWLEDLLKNDPSKLKDRTIEEYCDAYDHIKEYKKALKGRTARIMYRSR